MAAPNLRKLTKDFILEQEKREGPGGKDRHPYAILLDLAMSRDAKGNPADIPLTVRLLAAQSLLRTRLAVRSQAIQEVTVQNNREDQRPGRAEIISALSRATPAEIKAIFSKGEPLQLEESQDEHVTES